MSTTFCCFKKIAFSVTTFSDTTKVTQLDKISCVFPVTALQKIIKFPVLNLLCGVFIMFSLFSSLSGHPDCITYHHAGNRRSPVILTCSSSRWPFPSSRTILCQSQRDLGSFITSMITLFTYQMDYRTGQWICPWQSKYRPICHCVARRLDGHADKWDNFRLLTVGERTIINWVISGHLSALIWRSLPANGMINARISPIIGRAVWRAILHP